MWLGVYTLHFLIIHASVMSWFQAQTSAPLVVRRVISSFRFQQVPKLTVTGRIECSIGAGGRGGEGFYLEDVEMKDNSGPPPRSEIYWLY